MQAMPTDDAAVARLLDETRRICAMPAPPFGEGPRAELVAWMLGENGAPATIDDTGNVIARLGPADGDAIVFAAHLDTVFDAATEIRFEASDGRLAAPGVGDNSIAVAALLHLARHLRGRAPATPVALVATVGEEGLGDLRGAKAVVEEMAVSAFVAVEGQMLHAIKTAAVGSVRFRVTVRGPGGHPWSDRGTPSAAHGLVDALSGALAEAHNAGIVFNVGTMRGGTVINAIAGEAVAELDMRAEDDARLQATAKRVREVVAWAPAGLETTVEEIGRRPAGRIDGDHPLVAAARRARERAGLPPAEEGASSTDANAAYGRGIPAITVGVTTGGHAHRLDEYIDLAPIASGLAALEALAEELQAG
jgi:acetylornithine deacetylase/succinyl-diaminopimelate desuccinylase-like protein